MPIDHILTLLVAERDKLNRAIEALRGTSSASSQHKKPAPTLAATQTTNHARKPTIWTAAKRRAAAERAKAIWAKRRKQEGKKG